MEIVNSLKRQWGIEPMRLLTGIVIILYITFAVTIYILLTLRY